MPILLVAVEFSRATSAAVVFMLVRNFRKFIERTVKKKFGLVIFVHRVGFVKTLIVRFM